MDAPSTNPPAVPQTEPLAIVAFVLSLCGWFGFAFLAWIPAIVCGHVARSKIRSASHLQGDGFAVSALVISYVGLAFMVAAFVLFLGFFVFAAQHTSHQIQTSFPPHP